MKNTTEQEWAIIREELKKLKDTYIMYDDRNLKNLAVVIDILILCTYMPDELEPLYDKLQEHLDVILGGNN